MGYLSNFISILYFNNSKYAVLYAYYDAKHVYVSDKILKFISWLDMTLFAVNIFDMKPFQSVLNPDIV